MRLFLSIILFCVLAFTTNTQSAISHHIWQDARLFQPASRTAIIITGAITLSGNPDFATKGSSMTISFATGNEIELTSEGASWRIWDIGGSEDKQSAEVFRLERDPGALLNGNTLCRIGESSQPIFLVFSQGESLFGILPPKLNMAAFQSSEPPHDIQSPGLCGTFSYEIEELSDLPSTDVIKSQQGGTLNVGKWERNTSINPLNDSETVVLSLLAESGVSKNGNPVTFIARCQSDKTEVYVVWDDYLGDDSQNVYAEWKHVTVRVGESESRVEKWGVSTDRKATFAPDWAGRFLQELLDQNRLVLQTVPYGENPNTAIFDVTNLRNVLGDLAEACHWGF